ncbi:MAG: hypothetical protein WDA59_06015 [Methanofastidiosum sp.]|jgi:hypothetical protein
MFSRAKPGEVSISAVVKRANGKVENLGTISYWHKSLFKRAFFKISKFLRNLT